MDRQGGSVAEVGHLWMWCGPNERPSPGPVAVLGGLPGPGCSASAPRTVRKAPSGLAVVVPPGAAPGRPREQPDLEVGGGVQTPPGARSRRGRRGGARSGSVAKRRAVRSSWLRVKRLMPGVPGVVRTVMSAPEVSGFSGVGRARAVAAHSSTQGAVSQVQVDVDPAVCREAGFHGRSPGWGGGVLGDAGAGAGEGSGAAATPHGAQAHGHHVRAPHSGGRRHGSKCSTAYVWASTTAKGCLALRTSCCGLSCGRGPLVAGPRGAGA